MQRLLKKYTFPVARSAQMYWKKNSPFFQSLELFFHLFPIVGKAGLLYAPTVCDSAEAHPAGPVSTACCTKNTVPDAREWLHQTKP